MERSKVISKVKIKKLLRMYGGEILPVGTEITLTDEWETAPYHVRCRVILNPKGERRLVQDEELEYALGAH